MGVCASTSTDKAAKERSAVIDRQIEEDSKRFRREFKILLLGAGESGKSTVVKQMKIIHQNGYSKGELMLYRLTVIKNVVDSAQALVLALRKYMLEPEIPDNRENTDFILRYRVYADANTFLDPSMGKAIASLWDDPVIPKVMEKRSEFYLMDSAPYFFQQAERIASPDFIPNVEDVLRSRSKTTAITETRFTMNQWIHCFEAVTSIIFCVAISEYDQVLLEDGTQNRLEESIVLFDSIVNSRWFTRTSIILFLNKIDVFKEKIVRTPLSKVFEDFTGGSDYQRASKYILWRFTMRNRAQLSIYPHLTQATDTNQIRVIFAAVRETILQNALRDSGIL